jgi:hypothetical protein
MLYFKGKDFSSPFASATFAASAVIFSMKIITYTCVPQTFEGDFARFYFLVD